MCIRICFVNEQCICEIDLMANRLRRIRDIVIIISYQPVLNIELQLYAAL